MRMIKKLNPLPPHDSLDFKGGKTNMLSMLSHAARERRAPRKIQESRAGSRA